MTYAEAIATGYKELGTRWQRKYVSRKVDVDSQPLIKPGGKYRRYKDLWYVELPSWASTRYSHRVYLAAPDYETPYTEVYPK